MPGQVYNLRCRGQATPRSKEVVYEVFVEEVVAGPIPTIYADLLGTVDGHKAFHCRRMGLRLVPAWPLDQGRLEHPMADDARPVAQVGTHRFDHASLLACAWGKPSHAFGDMYRPFDGPRRVARLPGPPYHFMSRVLRVEGPPGEMQSGARAEVEYDVPPDAWYFDDNGRRVMPFCALLEVALQPCGWLASYVGCALHHDGEMVFRNLDGTGTVHREVSDDTKTLTTTTTLTSLSSAGGLVLVSFDVVVRAGGDPVYTLETTFGFFPLEAMANQEGLPTSDRERARLLEPSIDPPLAPAHLVSRLPAGRLRMLDRVTGLWPRGGEAGLGRIRAEKDVRASDWFFKAHFFQDPVQPGSLGLDAMLQALSILVLERGVDTNGTPAHLESPALAEAMTWKYRGQVLPENQRVVVDLQITDWRRETGGTLAVAKGSLWVDGKRIYEATGLALRLADDHAR